MLLENRYVIEGLMRGLRDNGYAYGLYSFTNGWQEITGGWRLPGVPVWATAGRLDYPNEALDRCTQPSFSGGRVYLSQWYDDTRDYDRTCGTYAFTTISVPRATLSNSTADFNGSWTNDLMARRSTTGVVSLFEGDGKSGLLTGVAITADWSKYDVLETIGDFSGDGLEDVLARERATGYLWLYRGNGRGGWLLPRVRMGSGWLGMDRIVGPVTSTATSGSMSSRDARAPGSSISTPGRAPGASSRESSSAPTGVATTSSSLRATSPATDAATFSPGSVRPATSGSTPATVRESWAVAFASGPAGTR
jgi:hypothetical protein